MTATGPVGCRGFLEPPVRDAVRVLAGKGRAHHRRQFRAELVKPHHIRDQIRPVNRGQITARQRQSQPLQLDRVSANQPLPAHGIATSFCHGSSRESRSGSPDAPSNELVLSSDSTVAMVPAGTIIMPWLWPGSRRNPMLGGSRRGTTLALTYGYRVRRSGVSATLFSALCRVVDQLLDEGL